MLIKISLPVRGFSVNATYYASRKIKTKEFREWEAQVSLLLQGNKDLRALGLLFNSLGGCFSVTYLFYYPEEIYWNSFGQISAKTFDLTNVEKTLQDLLFKEMGVDDRYIDTMRSYKRPAAQHSVDVILKLNSYSESDAASSIRAQGKKRRA